MSPTDAMPVLGWVDWTLLAVLAVSVVVGLWRGLVFELMSLVGWVVAYVAAQLYSPLVAVHLPIGLPGSALNLGAGFALTFFGVLIGWALGSGLGFCVGVAIDRAPFLQRGLLPLASLTSTVPLARSVRPSIPSRDAPASDTASPR